MNPVRTLSHIDYCREFIIILCWKSGSFSISIGNMVHWPFTPGYCRLFSSPYSRIWLKLIVTSLFIATWLRYWLMFISNATGPGEYLSGEGVGEETEWGEEIKNAPYSIPQTTVCHRNTKAAVPSTPKKVSVISRTRIKAMTGLIRNRKQCDRNITMTWGFEELKQRKNTCKRTTTDKYRRDLYRDGYDITTR